MNSPGGKEPVAQVQAQEMLARLQKSKLSDLSAIEAAQHGLEVRLVIFHLHECICTRRGLTFFTEKRTGGRGGYVRCAPARAPGAGRRIFSRDVSLLLICVHLQQDIIQATNRYTEWLGDVMPCPLVKADIAAKYQHMYVLAQCTREASELLLFMSSSFSNSMFIIRAEDPFMFMRATFYRWVQLWPVICPGLSGAPHGQSFRIGLFSFFLSFFYLFRSRVWK